MGIKNSRKYAFIGLCLYSCFSYATDVEAMSLLSSVSKEDIAKVLEISALFTCISLLPSALILLTSFTRNVIVLSLLRTALGLQQTPPNSILISIALLLTSFTMMPVAQEIYEKAYVPYQHQQISLEEAWIQMKTPLQSFMEKQTREKDMEVILELTRKQPTLVGNEHSFFQLIPAFLLSELQTAFQIGFLIFLPFILIDILVSGILLTLGIMMMPPQTISLPIKLLLFVLIDGWDLLLRALADSIHV